MMIKFAFLLILPCVFGQEIIEKECSAFNITTQQEFDMQRYLGKWHELMRYETTFELNGECVTSTWYLNNEDGNVKFINAMKQEGQDVTIEGLGFEQDPELHNGKLSVQYPGAPPANYWVLGTDYDNYAVIWSCYTFPSRSIQYLWVLARNTLVETEVSRDIEKVLADNGLNTNLLKPTKNDKDYCGF